MEQTNKLNWIKKSPRCCTTFRWRASACTLHCAAAAGQTCCCPWETGFVFFPLAAVYYLSNQLLCKKYLVAENRALTYWVSVATFVVIYLSMSILCADLLQWLLHFF